MEIKIEKYTNIDLVRKACEATMRGQKSKISLDKIYQCEHSPIRTQMFWIELIDIPTFCSVHLVRHKVGVEHFVMSNRTDRGGSGEENRYSPVTHCMWINAQTLINMGKKRLCSQASKETQEVFNMIKDAIKWIDLDLYKYLVVECEYRGGICPELRCCGRNKLYINKDK
jgi:hypothetical protein